MARKKLIKGPNAERVEQRIAQVPEDITETSIFKVLKEIEEKSKSENEEAIEEVIKEKRTRKKRTKKKRATKKETTTSSPESEAPKKRTTLQEALIGGKPIEINSTDDSLEPTEDLQEEKTDETATEEKKATTKKKRGDRKVSFTKAEKEIIIKSCTNYKNTLPIYLKSVQREVKLIDNVIKKLK